MRCLEFKVVQSAVDPRPESRGIPKVPPVAESRISRVLITVIAPKWTALNGAKECVRCKARILRKPEAYTVHTSRLSEG
jgi:hypothetical protein